MGYDNLPNIIFVFGSNLRGIHGRGAALYAKQHYGAVWGVGEGRTGQSYAIPTKDENLRPRSLTAIQQSIETFLAYAHANPDFNYVVTRIGCGYAHKTNEQIAPFFRDAPACCWFDPEWGAFGLNTWAA